MELKISQLLRSIPFVALVFAGAVHGYFGYGAAPAVSGLPVVTLVSTFKPQWPISELPSRSAQRDARGFYFQPAGLADDYPEETTTVEGIKSDLSRLRELGVRYYRVGIGWDSIEERPGEYNWRYWDDLVALAPAYGVTVIPYICYTPAWLSDDPVNFWRSPPRDPRRFERFMYEISHRYAGKILSWELWNEPDIENYWLGDEAQFAELIREGAKGVRRGDPHAKVVLGGMAKGRSPFLEKVFRDLRIGELVDVVNVHGYLETWESARAEDYPRRLQEVRDLAPGKDLWLAEFGYSDYRESDRQVSEWSEAVYGYEHTPEYQAVSLWKAHVLAAASEDVSLTTWYRLHDLPKTGDVIGDAHNRHLGILDVDGNPKPAFRAMALYVKIFDEPFRVIGAPVDLPVNSQSVLHVFEEKDGDLIVTGWLRGSHPEEVKDSSGKATDSRSEEISVRLSASPDAQLVLYSIGEPRGLSAPIEGEAARLENGVLTGVHLSGDAVFIAEIRSQY